MSPVKAFQTAACGFAISKLRRWVVDVISVLGVFLGMMSVECDGKGKTD